MYLEWSDPSFCYLEQSSDHLCTGGAIEWSLWTWSNRADDPLCTWSYRVQLCLEQSIICTVFVSDHHCVSKSSDHHCVLGCQSSDHHCCTWSNEWSSLCTWSNEVIMIIMSNSDTEYSASWFWYVLCGVSHSIKYIRIVLRYLYVVSFTWSYPIWLLMWHLWRAVVKIEIAYNHRPWMSSCGVHVITRLSTGHSSWTPDPTRRYCWRGPETSRLPTEKYDPTRPDMRSDCSPGMYSFQWILLGIASWVGWLYQGYQCNPSVVFEDSRFRYQEIISLTEVLTRLTRPPKSGKIVTRTRPEPDPTRSDPTRGSIRPVDNSGDHRIWSPAMDDAVDGWSYLWSVSITCMHKQAFNYCISSYLFYFCSFWSSCFFYNYFICITICTSIWSISQSCLRMIPVESTGE